MCINSCCRGSLLIVLLSVFLCCTMLAGNDVQTVQVTSISCNSNWTDLQLQLMKSLKARLQAKGATVTDKSSDWVLLVDATPIDQVKGDLTVVSVIVLHSIPKEVIELSKKAEVFYANLSDEKRMQLLKEGKWVREMVSEEVISQYSMPINKELLVVSKNDFEQTISKIVDNFYLQYLKNK
jgi:hypothetical protein